MIHVTFKLESTKKIIEILISPISSVRCEKESKHPKKQYAEIVQQLSERKEIGPAEVLANTLISFV